MEPAIRAAIEISGIIDSINKVKSIPNSLLDAGYNLANSKINIDPLSLLRGSGLTVTKMRLKMS